MGKNVKFVTDAKFYKPSNSVAQSVEARYLDPSVTELYDLSNWGYGKRVSRDYAEDAFMGFFEIEGLSEKTKHDILEQYWTPRITTTAHMLIYGTGLLVAARPKEKVVDLARPVAPGQTDYKWYAPDPQHINVLNKKYPTLDPVDAGEFSWYTHKIHPSRIEFMEMNHRDDNWMGNGLLAANAVALWGLYNLEKGCLTRGAAWSMLTFAFKTDPKALSLMNTTQKRDLQDALLTENIKVMGKEDEVIQLADGSSNGTEMHDLLTKSLSAGTSIPKVCLEGSNAGSVTGSEVNVSLYGQACSRLQSMTQYFDKKILKKWYNIDANEIEYIVKFYQTEKSKLELEAMKKYVEEGGVKDPSGKGGDTKKEGNANDQ